MLYKNIYLQLENIVYMKENLCDSWRGRERVGQQGGRGDKQALGAREGLYAGPQQHGRLQGNAVDKPRPGSYYFL